MSRNSENKNLEKNKSGKEIKHLDTFFSLSLSLTEIKGTAIYMFCAHTPLICSVQLSLWNVADLDVRINNHVADEQSSRLFPWNLLTRNIPLLSFGLEQSFQQAYEESSSQDVSVHHLLTGRKSRLPTTIPQAQGRRAKEGDTEDIDDAETNRQVGYSLLQRRHWSWRASQRTLTTGSSREINFE